MIHVEHTQGESGVQDCEKNNNNNETESRFILPAKDCWAAAHYHSQSCSGALMTIRLKNSFNAKKSC